VAVRQLVSTEEPLGLGLWLSAQTTDELQESESSQHELAEWFQTRQLVPYTMNAFPFGDFHGATVKYAVYKPEWWCPERADYTKRVVSIFDNLLPADEPGTISTLPIGWPGPKVTDEHFREAAPLRRRLTNVCRRCTNFSKRRRWRLRRTPGTSYRRRCGKVPSQKASPQRSIGCVVVWPPNARTAGWTRMKIRFFGATGTRWPDYPDSGRYPWRPLPVSGRK